MNVADFGVIALTSIGYFADPNVLTKVLPILYLISLVIFDWKSLQFVSYTHNRSRFLTAIGLIFSAGGDACLVYEGELYFLAGLGLFLLAHVFYIASYLARGAKVTHSWFNASILVAFFITIMTYLLPTIINSQIKYHVVVYGLTISLMGLLALNKYSEDNGMWPAPLSLPASRLALIGSLFFIVSDSALAINKFRAPFEHARLVVMVTYYIGQAFIAAANL